MIKNNMKWIMKGKSKFDLAFALTTMLFLSMFAIPLSLGVDTPEIYLVSSTVSPSLEWNVTAWVKDVPAVNPTFAYQIALFFNTSFLECIQAYIPKSDDAWIFSGFTTVLPTPTIDNVGGFAVVGDSILIGESVSGSGPFSLVVFELRIKNQLDYDLLSYIKISIPDTCLINDALEEVPIFIKANSITDSVWSHASAKKIANSPYPEPSNSSLGITRIMDEYLRQSDIELIVGLKQNRQNAFGELASFAESYGGKITDTVSMNGKVVAAVVNVTIEQAAGFASAAKKTSFSTYVELNHEYRACMEPNDAYWSQQWGPKKIEANWAWNTTLGNTSVLVAVIDTGIDYNHPDLHDNYAFDEYGNPLGYDWVNDDPYPMDDDGHGTHCAGIITATSNNGEGIAGVAQVRIFAEKVLDASGIGYPADIANGIINATDYGADIISMSFGGYFYDETMYNACRYAFENGVLLVAAAGNEATSGTLYPAHYKEVIAVSATDQNDELAWFSNFGTWVELAAPGVSICSTLPNNGYSFMSGTSMATPHVAGVAALVWSQFPNLTRDQVRVHLRKTADDLGSSGFDINYGYGRVNARNAVEQSIPEHDLLILSWTRTPYAKMGEVTVNTTILNYGANDENYLWILLWRNGSLVDYESIDHIPSGNSTTLELSCQTPSEGIYNITIQVEPAPNEVDLADNVVWAYVGTEQGVIKVPDYYPTIQEGIDAATEGDTIQVSVGTYNEAVHIRRSNLSLIGESLETTVINGSGEIRGIWVVYAVEADDFRISGFTLQNSGGFLGGYNFGAGVALYFSNNCTIIDNIFSNNKEGIYLLGAYNNTIANNNIISSSDTGIALLFWGSGNLVSENTIESSENAGIGLYGLVGEGDSVTDNIVKGNGYGIHISANSLVTGNKVVENVNHGISLWGSASGVTVRDNHFRDNGQGIDIFTGYNNNIYWNNFINNTDQVNGASPNTWNGYWNVTGNYWSDYTGNNTDEDIYEIGDNPYVIDENNQDNFPFMDPYLPGDIKHDGKVDIFDVVIVAAAYGTHGPPNPSPKWDPHADLNEDNNVNSLDLAMVSANYGKTWQSYWGE